MRSAITFSKATIQTRFSLGAQSPLGVPNFSLDICNVDDGAAEGPMTKFGGTGLEDPDEEGVGRRRSLEGECEDDDGAAEGKALKDPDEEGVGRWGS